MTRLPDDQATELLVQSGCADESAELQTRLAALIGQAARAQGSTLVVGLCGPQGSGKSTLAERLRDELDAAGLRTAVLSLDDLYLRRRERERLAAEVHPLLRTRGVPGTHDVPLGLEVLGRLTESDAALLPRFDKASDDRRPRAEWEGFAAPCDVVLFEGWCVGARPQRTEALRAPVNALERDEDPDRVWRTYVNEALAGPYQDLFAAIDYLILLEAPDFTTVLTWRREQEHKLRDRLRAEGRGLEATMDDAQVARFVQHYERLTRYIAAEMPARAQVRIALDAQRRARLLPLGRRASE